MGAEKRKEASGMPTVRYAEEADREFWFGLDRHLPESEFERKVRDRQAYVILSEGAPAGLMRYGLFWDEIPFCSMLVIAPEYRGRGMGKALMTYWENEMAAQGYDLVMTSSQSDETAQHFYRKLGYRDSGVLLLEAPGREQPAELFFIKATGK